MSSGCFACCTGKREFSGQSKEGKEESNGNPESAVTFAPDEVEVVNVIHSDFKLYWRANNAAVGGKVKVREKVWTSRPEKREIFKVSRHPVERLWSFSVKTKKESLFISYNDDSDKVLYQHEGKGANRYFILVVKPMGAIYLKTGDDSKYIFNMYGALGLTPATDWPTPWCFAQDWTYNFSWYKTGYIVEMVEPEKGRKWNSAAAESQQHVVVQSSTSEQLWRMVPGWAEDERIWSFYAITKNKELHLTYGHEVKNGLKLDNGDNEMKRSFFAINAGEGLIRLQRCEEPQHFLCVSAKNNNDELLGFCEQEADAAKWQPRIAGGLF